MPGSEWIVKLIPFGNKESDLFVLKTEGGTGIEDFAGWHLDQFAFTTDVNGEAVATLRHAPTSLQTCYVMQTTEERILFAFNLSGFHLSVRKYKLRYDKTNTPIGFVSNAPSGVSVASSSGALTEDATSTGSVAITTTAASDGSGAGPDDAISDATAVLTMNAHHHATNVLYDHKHTLLYTQTALPIAPFESSTMLVLYQ